jgi:hypothetical protein
MVPCSNTGKIFWSTSVNKKKFYKVDIKIQIKFNIVKSWKFKWSGDKHGQCDPFHHLGKFRLLSTQPVLTYTTRFNAWFAIDKGNQQLNF